MQEVIGRQIDSTYVRTSRTQRSTASLAFAAVFAISLRRARCATTAATPRSPQLPAFAPPALTQAACGRTGASYLTLTALELVFVLLLLLLQPHAMATPTNTMSTVATKPIQLCLLLPTLRVRLPIVGRAGARARGRAPCLLYTSPSPRD